jgi:hypothetical protein
MERKIFEKNYRESGEVLIGCFRSVSKSVSNGVSNAVEKMMNETRMLLSDCVARTWWFRKSVTFGVSNSVSNGAPNETKQRRRGWLTTNLIYTAI